jgi:hypothetical protein
LLLGSPSNAIPTPGGARSVPGRTHRITPVARIRPVGSASVTRTRVATGYSRCVSTNRPPLERLPEHSAPDGAPVPEYLTAMRERSAPRRSDACAACASTAIVLANRNMAGGQAA